MATLVEGQAFALVENERIYVDTISSAPRGVMVNTLVSMAGIMVFNNWSDHMIEKAFEGYCLDKAYEIKEIKVKIK